MPCSQQQCMAIGKLCMGTRWQVRSRHSVDPVHRSTALANTTDYSTEHPGYLAQYQPPSTAQYLQPSTASRLLPCADQHQPLGMSRYEPAALMPHGPSSMHGGGGSIAGSAVSSVAPTARQHGPLLRDLLPQANIGQMPHPMPHHPAPPVLHSASSTGHGPHSDYTSREYSDFMSHPTQAKDLVQWAINRQDSSMWANGNPGNGGF